MEAIIVGAGIIAGGPSQDPLESYFSNHFAEYLKKNISVTWIIDINIDRARSFAHKYNIPNVGTDIRDVTSNANEIFLSICSSTDSHFSIFCSGLEHFRDKKLRVWLEKPSSHLLDEIKKMEILASKAHCDVLINYPRRYDQNFTWVKNLIESDKLQKVFLRYSKGCMHNLPHFINILHWYCGDLKEVEFSKLTTRNNFIDLDGIFIFGDTEVVISSVNHQYFDHYELDILLDDKMFRFQDGGLELEEFEAVNRFSNSQKFLKKMQTYPSSSHDAMTNSLDALIHGGDKVHTNLNSDYRIHADIKTMLKWGVNETI